MSEVLNYVWAIISEPTWRMWVGGLLCLLGGVSTIIASVGVLRFPDFYTRLHAASVTDTLGAFSFLIGMALIASEFGSVTFIVVLKLFMIGIFLVLTGPTSTHAIGNAAYTAGLHPLIGRIDQLRAAEDGEEDA